MIQCCGAMNFVGNVRIPNRFLERFYFYPQRIVPKNSVSGSHCLCASLSLCVIPKGEWVSLVLVLSLHCLINLNFRLCLSDLSYLLCGVWVMGGIVHDVLACQVYWRSGVF